MGPSPPLSPVTVPAVPRYQRLLAPVRAGAFAAGGGIVALAVAIAIDPLVTWHRLPFFVWITATLASVALAVLFGYPDPARRAWAYFERTLGVLLFGLVLGMAAVVPVATYLGRDSQDAEAISALVAAGALLLLLARVTMPARRIEAYIPDGPGGLLPPPPAVEQAGSYALAAAGPALTAEECERDAPAVEVRVLWGGDVLRVRHLAPPRSYRLGDAGADFVIDGELVGAARFPVVLVDAAGVSAVAPRGAAAMIHAAPGRHRSIEQALADGLAEPYEGVAPGTRIPLVQGMRVTITLPSRAAGTAYRATHEEARLVIEVALVRAGRVVGRAPDLGGAGRLLASSAAAAGVLLGVLHVAETRPADQVDEDDGTTYDQKLAMVQAYQAIAERAQIEEEEREQEQLARETVEQERRRERGDSWNGPVGRFYDFRPPYLFDELRRRPFDSFAEIDLFGPRVFCASVAWTDQAPGPDAPFLDAKMGLCQTPVVTPFGLRSTGAPPSRDVLGRDPTDRWALDLERARHQPYVAVDERTAGAIARARVRIEPRTAPDAYASRWMIDRAVRRRAHDLRECYALGLRTNPGLEGSVEVVATVGRDGMTHAHTAFTAGMPDTLVMRCVAAAIDGMVVEPPPPQVRTWTYRVLLRTSEETARK